MFSSVALPIFLSSLNLMKAQFGAVSNIMVQLVFLFRMQSRPWHNMYIHIT